MCYSSNVPTVSYGDRCRPNAQGACPFGPIAHNLACLDSQRHFRNRKGLKGTNPFLVSLELVWDWCPGLGSAFPISLLQPAVQPTTNPPTKGHLSPKALKTEPRRHSLASQAAKGCSGPQPGKQQHHALAAPAQIGWFWKGNNKISKAIWVPNCQAQTRMLEAPGFDTSPEFICIVMGCRCDLVVEQSFTRSAAMRRVWAA